MKLLIINGSPRGTNSNTRLLFEKFVGGITSIIPNAEIEVCYLYKVNKHVQIIEKFTTFDKVIIGFPLYADAMPGIVMKFIEQIPESRGKNVGFVVQSGFPEAVHSIYIEHYLTKLAKRMGWNYFGTIIKGGVEGIKIMPTRMTKKLFASFFNLGKKFALHGSFDKEIISQLRSPLKFSAFRIFVAKLMSKIGLTNFYWNMKLKEHNAMNKRDDAPYGLAFKR